MTRKIKALGAVTWQLFEDIVWLPYAVAGILLMIVNFPS